MKKKLQKSILIAALAISGLSNIANAQVNLCQPYNMKSIPSTYFCNINGIMLIGGLWKSDGTTAGTVKINAAPSAIQGSFAILGNMAYFSSQNQIWKTDGTETGTVKVLDIPNTTNVYNLVSAGNFIFFLVSDNSGYSVNKLWKTDGTAAGTSMVKDIDPSNSVSWDPRALFAYNNNVYFKAGNSTFGVELWKSDGTSVGTVVVKDLNPGAGNGAPSGVCFAIHNNELYFRGGYNLTGAFSYGLWKTDGTDPGTSLVKALGSIDNLTEINGLLYIFAYDADGTGGSSLYGEELWKSDGTTAGTNMVKDIRPGSGSGISYGSQLANINGQVVFGGSDGSTGIELWASDGTAAGTHLLKDIFPGTQGSLGNYFTASGAVNGHIYFNANNGSIGRELWATDGTSAGTSLVLDIWPGIDSSSPWFFHTYNGNLYFSATESSSTGGVWSCGNFTDIQTIEGNQKISIYPNPSSEQLFIEVNDYTNSIVELFDVEGQLLQSAPLKSYTTSIQINNLTSGIYFIKVKSSLGMVVKKIIKD